MYDQIVSDTYKRKYKGARGHRLLVTVITLKPISISRISRFHLRRWKFLSSKIYSPTPSLPPEKKIVKCNLHHWSE